MKVRRKKVDESSRTLPYIPKTQLGEKLLAIRSKIITKGKPLLNWQEIEEEVADRRGEHKRNLNDTDLP